MARSIGNFWQPVPPGGGAGGRATWNEMEGIRNQGVAPTSGFFSFLVIGFQTARLVFNRCPWFGWKPNFNHGGHGEHGEMKRQRIKPGLDFSCRWKFWNY